MRDDRMLASIEFRVIAGSNNRDGCVSVRHGLEVYLGILARTQST